ncbi:MAG TPA: adenosylhomocysteinase [Candidatus Binataceae bacterium]|nr:adenosylhomocysteinase [Candidatus Binataceae bacterium]
MKIVEKTASKRKTAPKARISSRVPEFDIRDAGLAAKGRKRIEWADGQMPVLRAIRERFDKEKPLKGHRLGACLHITCETANLLRALKAGGAEVVACASNPLSTQDDVAAALVKEYGIPTYAIHDEDRDTYYSHLRAVLEHRPTVTMDDGADLVSLLHTEYRDRAKNVRASMEETTTGVIRLRAMEKDNALLIPVVAVNDAQTKHLFDNRYGTGQSTLDGIIRASGVLIAGSVVVVAGYGWCGRGIASRARGLGADVIVTEVDPVRALEAAMDGFRVMPMVDAAPIGDIFVSATGDKHVLAPKHFRLMKDGAILCNSGHFDVEIDMAYLNDTASKVEQNVTNHVDAYHIGGKRLFVLGQGRLVNLACAEGHPAQVMDMSFATQALASEWVTTVPLAIRVHTVPQKIEEDVAKVKLAAMSIKIDALTEDQKRYLESWESGT